LSQKSPDVVDLRLERAHVCAVQIGERLDRQASLRG
jgi:hypothetical protein